MSGHHSHKASYTQITLPDGTTYRACTCGAKFVKAGNELREIEITAAKLPDNSCAYSEKLKGDTITLQNRLKVEKGEITEQDAIALEEAAKA